MLIRISFCVERGPRRRRESLLEPFGFSSETFSIAYSTAKLAKEIPQRRAEKFLRNFAPYFAFFAV